jgi:5-methylcytosine-specific restriction endonuclease McrA
VDVEIHHVVPMAWGGSDTAANSINICGNAHNNVHALLRAYQRVGGTPEWEVRRRFSPYIRALAARGWTEQPIKETA